MIILSRVGLLQLNSTLGDSLRTIEDKRIKYRETFSENYSAHSGKKSEGLMFYSCKYKLILEIKTVQTDFDDVSKKILNYS